MSEETRNENTDTWLDIKFLLMFREGIDTIDGQHFHFAGPFETPQDAAKWITDNFPPMSAIEIMLAGLSECIEIAVPQYGKLPDDMREKRNSLAATIRKAKRAHHH